MITKTRFESEMAKAEAFKNAGSSIDYWTGYMRGLRKNYHGENFGTSAEHRLWMDAVNSVDEQRRQKGRGYRDGFNLDQ